MENQNTEGLLNLIASVSLGLLAAFIIITLAAYRKNLPALFSSARVSRHFYYSAIFSAGFFLYPEKMNMPWLPQFISGLVLINLLFASSMVLNNIYDVKIDKENSKSNALLIKGFSKKRYYLFYVVPFILSVPFSLSLSLKVLYASLAIHFTAWAYSCPPMRLKKYFPVNIMLISFSTVLAFILGFNSSPFPGREFPFRLALAFFGALSLAFNTKDINDYSGDKKYGVSTIMTIFGAKKGKNIIALLALAGYFFVPVILGAWNILPQAALCGTATCAHILIAKEKVNEPLIFFIFFLFAGFFAASFFPFK